MSRLTVLIAACTLAASGCAAAHQQAPSAVAPDTACVLAPAPVTPRDTIVVGITGDIDVASLADPRTHEERFLAGVLYEPLVGIDCEGRPLPTGGGYRLEPGAPALLRLVPVDSTSAPVIVLRRAAGGDARDLVDAGVDLLVTDAAPVLQYAAAKPELKAHPLPWDRTYVLLLPDRVAGAPAVPDSTPVVSPPPTALGELLARDAVRTDARAAAGPFPWDHAAGCRLTTPASSPSRAAPSPRRRIVYPEGDAVARGLAERLVALAAIGTREPGQRAPLDSALPELTAAAPRLTAAPLPARELTTSLGAGNELGYLVSLAHRPLSPCAEVQRLASSAPWLVDPPAGAAARAMVPLVDTRSHVVLRRGAVGVSVDAGGTLRLLPAADTSRRSAP